MDSAYSLLQSFNHAPCFISSSVILAIIIIIRLLKTRVFCCNCEICKTYIESRWSLQFPNLCDWYTHLLKSSPTHTVHIHVLNNTITANPDNVEYMLKTRFDNFPKGKPFSVILGDFLGRGIFNVDGDSWSFQRKMASLELGRVSIRAYSFLIVTQEINRRLLPILEATCSKNETLDLQDVFRRLSFDSICRFSFGLDPKCLERSLPMSEFAVSFDLASKLSAERAMIPFPIIWKMKKFLNIGSEKKLQQSIKTIHVLARDIIRQRRKYGLFSGQMDLLSRFMASTEDETYLRDIIVSFLLAGRDSVASALTGFFWLVARHPDVEAAILREADRVLEHSSVGPTSYEQLRELHYVHAAVYESMRLYPPIQFDSKFCLEDDVLPDGCFVKKGTRVTYHPYAMGRMEEVWGPDCLEFKPERWLRDGVFFNESPFKFPVFQAGLRVCLGKEMALVEIKCVAISILRRFRAELVGEVDGNPRFSPGLTATFRDGLRVFVRARP
ncbi:cytochrome p450 94c1 [Phtheirospermum japonicum]|uniref:Cytochrome p450 94c1 n=1 Tax=Phtheirospermum japonicum TaxID=374723 RepID=A0A830CML1_9LAMI|nr:cytochrome p450 94c1 [Phtheirospermum japonicum]